MVRAQWKTVEDSGHTQPVIAVIAIIAIIAIIACLVLGHLEHIWCIRQGGERQLTQLNLQAIRLTRTLTLTLVWEIRSVSLGAVPTAHSGLRAQGYSTS